MIFWSQTEDGWAVNLDGTNAALQFTLPRIEIRSGPRGWTCACHLDDGTSHLVPLGRPANAAAAMRAGAEGSLAAVGARAQQYETGLRELLGTPS
jgi:hypothetical protein